MRKVNKNSNVQIDCAKKHQILFDKTLEHGIIPSDWKLAEVRPIFKKGKKDNPGNYRPVSLTSIICKIFEGFIKNALCKHLTVKGGKTKYVFLMLPDR